MPQSATAATSTERRARAYRLGFRVDAETKRLVERAAALERRSLTDFCLSALTDASRAPKPNARLRRAFRSARERVTA
jgi:hypothetical protein